MPDHGILIALPQVPFVSLTTNTCLPTADVVDSVIFDGDTLRAALMARRFFSGHPAIFKGASAPLSS